MTIAFYAGSPADQSIIAPVFCGAYQQAMKVKLFYGGRIETPPGPRLNDAPAGDAPFAIALSAGDTVQELTKCLLRNHATALVLAGDRTEVLAAALAATCLRIPILHIHGGETTLGAIDDQCRHAISMLATHHAVAHHTYAERLLSWGLTNVQVTGAPSLDPLLQGGHVAPWDEVNRYFAGALKRPFALVAYHPATKGEDPVSGPGLCALEIPSGLDVVACLPNSDTGSRAVAKGLEKTGWHLVERCGTRIWWGLMAEAVVMIGNSSSMLIEAPSFGLPCVHIGDRQKGRLRVPYDARSPTRMPRPTELGDGKASQRIVEMLRGMA